MADEETGGTAKDADEPKPKARAPKPPAARASSRAARPKHKKAVKGKRAGARVRGGGPSRSRAAVVLLVMLGLVVAAGGGFMAWKQMTKEKVISLQMVNEFGGSGKNDGQFEEPRDLGVDSAGNLLVVDMRNYRIQKFSPEGQFLMKFGSQGTGKGEFNDPTGIAVDPKDNVYVADMGNGRIQKFDAKGKFLAEWKGDKYRWYGPRDLACDSEGNVYVSDTGNGQVKKVSPEGEVIRVFAGYGEKKGRLNNPNGVAVDKEGSFYVCDTCNRRIQKYSREGQVIGVSGAVRSWPKRVPVPLCEPFIAIGPNGDYFVTEPTARPAGGRGEGAIRIYGPDGEFLGRCERPRQGANFAKPMGIAVSKDGSIYVVNHDSCTVQKFSPFSG